jgi:DNA-binding beta-propeller fold protein YncE
VNPATQHVYVTSLSRGVNNLAIIDATINRVIANVAVSGTTEMAINTATNRIYVTDATNNSVNVVQDLAALPPVVVTARLSASAQGQTTVDIFITNNTDSDLTEMVIRGTIPGGGAILAANPPQFNVVGNQVIWINQGGVTSGATFTGYQYRVQNGSGIPAVTVDFIGKTRGTASTLPGF